MSMTSRKMIDLAADVLDPVGGICSPEMAQYAIALALTSIADNLDKQANG